MSYPDDTVEAAQKAELAAGPSSRPAHVCPDFHQAVELIGKRWAGVIIWALAERPRTTDVLVQLCPMVVLLAEVNLLAIEIDAHSVVAFGAQLNRPFRR